MKKDMLALSVGNGLYQLEWYIDAAFGVHPDYKEHTGAALEFKGAKDCPVQKCSKQKLNTSRSTMCKLVGVDDTSHKVLLVHNKEHGDARQYQHDFIREEWKTEFR